MSIYFFHLCYVTNASMLIFLRTKINVKSPIFVIMLQLKTAKTVLKAVKTAAVKDTRQTVCKS